MLKHFDYSNDFYDDELWDSLKKRGAINNKKLSQKEIDVLQFEKEYDERVEKIILGNILVSSTLEKDITQDVISVLKVEDFYIESHRKIYQAILKTYKESNEVNIILVKRELENIGELDLIGGLVYLSDLVEIGATDRDIKKYVEYIKNRRE